MISPMGSLDGNTEVCIHCKSLSSHENSGFLVDGVGKGVWEGKTKKKSAIK